MDDEKGELAAEEARAKGAEGGGGGGAARAVSNGVRLQSQALLGVEFDFSSSRAE